MNRRVRLSIGLAVLTATSLGAQVQQAAKADPTSIDPISHEGYIEPPAALKALIDVPRNTNGPFGAPNPSRQYFTKMLREGMPLLSVLGKDHYNLGGWQIEHHANRARSLTTGSSYGIELYDWNAGKTIKVELPAGARANGASWSPDGKTFAYLAEFDTATHIYFVDPATGKGRPFTKSSLLATNVTSFYWTADGKSIVAVLIPDGRGAEPKQAAIATEPLVRVNLGSTLRTRTLPDLIESPYEKALLEYHMTGQLALIDIKTRAVKKIGAPGMIRSINASPDGQYFRVTYLDKPFSYFQQISSFGTTEVLIDQTGKVIRTLAKRPLREGTPDDDPTPDPTDPNNPNPPDSTNANNPAARGGAPAGGRAGQAGRGGAQGGRGGQQEVVRRLRDTTRRNVTWHPFDGGQMFFQTAPAPAGADSAALTRLADRIVHMPNPADTMAVKTIYETPQGNCITNVRFSDNGRILFVTEQGRSGGEVAVFLDENNARFVVPIGGAGAGGAFSVTRVDSGAAAPPAGRGGTAAGGRGGNGRGGNGGGAGAGTTLCGLTGAANAGGGRGAGGGGGGGGGRGGAQGGGGAGGFEMKPGSRGFQVVQLSTDGKSVFTRGGGNGRPTVDRVEIKTGTRTRVYESNSPIGETITAALDDDFNKILVSRSSTTDVTQSYIVDTKTKEAKQVTDNKNLQPQAAGLIRKTVYARRPDNNVNIRVNVTLPADWKPGTKLPALFWFYPSEFENADAYTQSLQGRGGGAGRGNAAGGQGAPGGVRTGNVPTFAPRAMAMITQVGYALVEPDAPILGTELGGALPNDNYVKDLQRDLQAVVDMLADSGFVDKNRLAIGGHSYGGFSTVNALVHTTLFKAGIAGDGNYNRTLTPNGFQNERRTLWQGRDTYLAMSPFLYADQLTGALLLYHSMEDQNVGTDPINSPKLFHALQGLGKTTAMYMYPYEDHGPVARETVLDQWARWVAWLDKYVKNAGTKPVM